jgi:hypothetical protein
MTSPRALRSLLLVAASTVAAGMVATASATARSSAEGAPASSSPHVGEPLKPSNAEQTALSEHLRQRGALFYGAWWCPACFMQKNLFGKQAGNRLPYVECDKSDAGRARCEAASIRAFPTWDLPGKPRLEGVQSLDTLKVWSDFQPGTRAAK